MKQIPRVQVITDEVLQTRYTHAQLARLAVVGGPRNLLAVELHGALLREAQLGFE